MNHPDDPQQTPVSAQFRLVLAGLLAVLLVASTTWLVIVLLDRNDDDSSSRQGDREAVMSQATTFAELYLNYDTSDLDDQKQLTDYVAEIKPLMTAEGAKEFEKSAPALAQLIAKHGFTSTADVSRSGVQSLGADSAEVIVAGTLTGTQQGEQVGPTSFQMSLNLDRVDGEWLVDDFTQAGEEVP